jgi:hypothetical protein
MGDGAVLGYMKDSKKNAFYQSLIINIVSAIVKGKKPLSKAR